MKALVLNSPGLPDSLSISDRPIPDPPEGSIRVKVMAVGLNPVDYKTAGIGVPDWSYPHILGLDVAGVVDALGHGVDTWQIGQRVFYHGDLSKPGGYAEYAVAPAHICAAIPEPVSFEHAAAIPCAGYTAWQILTRKIPLKKGQVILVHGGAGGVGGFAVQMSRHLGLKVLSTCSKEKFD
jgi:NADPH2:quinone reductase